MKSTKKQLTTAFAGVLLACFGAYGQNELYNNAANPIGVDFSFDGAEFGDQVILDFSNLSADLADEDPADLSANLQNIFFQYFADMPTDATVRLYANNGAEVTGGDGGVNAPGDVLFDSGPFSLQPAIGSTVSVPLAGVNVPQTFTWSVDFSSPFAGLSVAGPPSVGDGWDDLWKLEDDTWVLNNIMGVEDSSFSAIIDGEVVPEPSTVALGAMGALLLGVGLFRRRRA